MGIYDNKEDNLRMLKRIWKKRGFWIVIISIFIILFIPFIAGILHSFPTADDFAMITQDDGSIIGHSISSAKGAEQFYFSWGGGWFYIFLEFLLNPLYLFGYQGYGYGIEMCIIFLVFSVSVLIGMCIILRKFCGIEDLKVRLVVSFFALSAILSVHFEDIWYWYVGSSYAWAVTMEIIAIVMIVSFFTHPTKLSFALSMILGVLACNNLNNCVPLGLIYLFLWIKKIKEEKKIRLWYGIPLLFSFISGVVSVMSPGNFARQDAGLENGNASIIKGIAYTGEVTITGFIKIISNPTVAVTLITSFVLGFVYNISKKEKVTISAIPFWGGILLLFGALFPTSYGYQSTLFPNRIEFVYMTFFVLYYIAILAKLGCCFAMKFNYSFIEKKGFKQGLFAGLLLYGYSCVMLTGFFASMPWIKQIDRLGAMHREHRIYVAILDEISKSTDENVEIDIREILSKTTGEEILIESGVIAPLAPSLMTAWSIAPYYNKKSIVIKGLEEVIVKWEDV